jgi:signal transduction histidine kinase
MEKPELIPIASQIEVNLKEAFDLRSTDLHQSIKLTQEILRQCATNHREDLEIAAKTQLGLFHLIQGEFDTAMQYSTESLNFFEAHSNFKGVADAKYNIASIYYRTNKYHQAILLFLDSLQYYREANDYYNQARTLKSMGTIYEYFNDQDKAIESYEKSIAACREIGEEALESNALSPLSAIYFKQGKELLAVETIERSVALKIKTNDVRGLAFALYGRAKILIKQGVLRKAILDLEETIRIQLDVGDKLGLAMAYNKMGVAYMEIGDLKTALRYFLMTIDICTTFKVQFILFKVYYNLYLLAKTENDPARALDCLEKHLQIRETVINKENYELIKSYEAVTKIDQLEFEAKKQLEKNEIIERKNAELDSFFYRISHDLKGPISSLLGLKNIVKMDVTDEASLILFSMYHSQIVRVNDIIMGLINLTEIKNTEKLKSIINFGKLVDECVDSCRYLPQFGSVRIEKSIQNFEFRSEWAIINTILQNLIENAIKYSRAQTDAFVHIDIALQDNIIVVKVADNGQGIPDAYQENIFNIFFRATNRTQGSGLGLYILKRAVERINGTIMVESMLGVGSTFTISIPM